MAIWDVAQEMERNYRATGQNVAQEMEGKKVTCPKIYGVLLDGMSHRKWRETNQQPGRTGQAINSAVA